MSEDLLSRALQAVTSAVNSKAFLRVVGSENQQFLLERLDRVNVCLSATPGSDRPGKQSRALYSLARECIDLASVVDREPLDSEKEEVSEEATQDGWDPRIIVAEAAANALAAFATSVQPDSPKASADLLEHLSLDLSYLSMHIFNGLCRFGGGAQHRAGPDRMLQALQAICAWSIAAVGRSIGYSNLTTRILWEWAREDAVWMFTLVKGLLSSSTVHTKGQSAILLPRDLLELQAAVTMSMFGLTSPAMAFSGEAGVGDDDTIAARNEELMRHRVELASAVVNCQLPQVLATSSTGIGCRTLSGLPSFLVILLQPELTDACAELNSSTAVEAMSEVLIGAPSSTGADTIRQAQAASASLTQQLQSCRAALWAALAAVPGSCGGRLPPAFLSDCAALAYFVPPPAESLEAFCRQARGSDQATEAAALTAAPCRQAGGTGQAKEEAALTAALCLLAANAGLVPSSGGSLAEYLLTELRGATEAIAARWERWRGPVKAQELGEWAKALKVSWVPPPAAPPTVAAPSTASPAATSPPPAPPKPSPGRGSVLQELIRDAPSEFRCALSGQLLMDPVEAPGGVVFDRAALLSALGSQSGVCPVTGNALALSECKRMPALRKKVACWVRDHRACGGGAAGRRR